MTSFLILVYNRIIHFKPFNFLSSPPPAPHPFLFLVVILIGYNNDYNARQLKCCLRLASPAIIITVCVILSHTFIILFYIKWRTQLHSQHCTRARGRQTFSGCFHNNLSDEMLALLCHCLYIIHNGRISISS